MFCDSSDSPISDFTKSAFQNFWCIIEVYHLYCLKNTHIPLNFEFNPYPLSRQKTGGQVGMKVAGEKQKPYTPRLWRHTIAGIKESFSKLQGIIKLNGQVR
jgi:hypothetical protein